MPLTTIILLTGQVEFPFLAGWLQAENARIQMISTPTLGELKAISPDVLAQTRLIAFSAGEIVPRTILERLGYGAYNFHPGPPHYPGWAPATFAIYDGAATFGVTAHEMRERVDSGPIVGVELFAIPPDIGMAKLEALAYVTMARLFQSYAARLVNQMTPLQRLEVAWSGRKTSRRDFNRLCDIPVDISEAELARRAKAIESGEGIQRPTVTLHGRRFILQPAASGETPAAPPNIPLLKPEDIISMRPTVLRAGE